jgi:hypothetical protein
VDQGATGKPAPSQKVYVTGLARDGSLLGQLQCARMCWRAVFGSAGRAGLLKTQRAAAAGHKPKRQVNNPFPLLTTNHNNYSAGGSARLA